MRHQKAAESARLNQAEAIDESASMKCLYTNALVYKV